MSACLAFSSAALAALRIFIGACLDDHASRSIARKSKVRKGEMERPAVDPFDDGIGGPFQLVMQTTRHQAAEDGISGLVAMEGKAGDVGLVAGRRHGAMHRLDDVRAYLEFAKRLFQARLQGEAGNRFSRCLPLCESLPARERGSKL